MTSTPPGKSVKPSADSSERIPALGAGRAVVLLLATLALIGVLGSFDACNVLAVKLTGGGETVRMQPTRVDPREIDAAHGENLLETLSKLPRTEGGRERVLFVGNSQQYTASLPRGAVPDESRKVEISSLQFAHLLEQKAPGQFQVFAGAAPNQTFAEALWQGLYWFRVSTHPPKVLVLQASFDTFRKEGIRPGFQTLLGDTDFVRVLETFEREHPSRAWSSAFEQAKKARADREREARNQADKKRTVESALRDVLEMVPLYANREQKRASFLELLYLARVHALGISPTTRRHIIGQPLEENFQALEDLADVAIASGATVLIYNAPVNPAVDMFFPDEYAMYLARLNDLSKRCSVGFADLRDAVSRDEWGYWIDGPDPIHFDEHGHEALAKRLFEVFGTAASAPSLPAANRPACSSHGLH